MLDAQTKKSLGIVFLIVATELIGFGLIIPVLPQIVGQLGVNFYMVGFLLASYSLAQFIASPILGALSDRYGRKPILAISKLGTFISYIIFGLSSGYAGLLIARLLDGFTGGNISVARAYVTDITSEEDRPKGMAVIGVSFGVGFVLGPALGGLLYGRGHGFMLPAFVAGGLSLIAFLCTVFLLKEGNADRQKMATSMNAFKQLKLLDTGFVRFVLITQLMYMIVFSGFETTFSFFTFKEFGLTEQDNSVLFMFSGLFMLLFQGGLTRYAWKNLSKVLAVGFAFFALSFIGLGLLGSMKLMLVVLGFLALGVGLINTYLPSLLVSLTPDSDRGLAMGVFEGIGSLSRIIGPLVAYSLWAGNVRVLYLIYAGIMAGFCLIYYFTKRSNA